MNDVKKQVDFFVIGAARAGTTSLYEYLSQHPDIFLPHVKECNYFSKVESLDPEVYKEPKPGTFYHMKIIRSPEAYDSLFDEAKPNQLKGEISPSYLWDSESAIRIKDHNPDAKIIVSLRDPIDRAYSHYLMHFNTGHEPEKTFEKALDAEPNPIWGGGNNYLAASDYHGQLKTYFKLFDKDQILIMIYEEWTRDPIKSMNSVYEFLDVQSFSESLEFTPQNPTTSVKNRELLNFFRQPGLKAKLNRVVPEKARDAIKQAFFVSNEEKPELPELLRLKLKNRFIDEVRQLENLLNRPLTKIWNLSDD